MWDLVCHTPFLCSSYAACSLRITHTHNHTHASPSEAGVESLTLRGVPRQVLAANPRYSCGLAALVDAYCVNPEIIYAGYFLTARRYQEQYVHSRDDAAGDWHPFYNTTWPMEDAELTFIQDFGVTYLLADPEHAALIARKLAALDVGAAIAFTRDGYVLYKIR